LLFIHIVLPKMWLSGEDQSIQVRMEFLKKQ
jgi:hypothetical protein